MRDLAIRAVKTAVQTFAGLVTVDIFFAQDWSTVEKAAVTAAAAGASVLWNALLAWSHS